MHDLKAICDALATSLAGTSTPSGALAIHKAYAQMPKNLGQAPALVVVPQDGEVVLESGSWVVTHRIDVNLYVSKRQGDTVREETTRQLWVVPLLARVITTAYTLGLVASGLKSALPASYEFEELPYGGDIYDGVIFHFEAIVREAIAAVP